MATLTDTRIDSSLCPDCRWIGGDHAPGCAAVTVAPCKPWCDTRDVCPQIRAGNRWVQDTNAACEGADITVRGDVDMQVYARQAPSETEPAIYLAANGNTGVRFKLTQAAHLAIAIDTVLNAVAVDSITAPSLVEEGHPWWCETDMCSGLDHFADEQVVVGTRAAGRHLVDEPEVRAVGCAPAGENDGSRIVKLFTSHLGVNDWWNDFETARLTPAVARLLAANLLHAADLAEEGVGTADTPAAVPAAALAAYPPDER